MKKLNMFLSFDWPKFSKDKCFVCTGCVPWNHHDTGAHLGTKVEAAIIEDNTDYGDDSVTNLFEKVTFKVGKDINVPIGAEIQPKAVRASVYGDFRNKLSCVAEDIAFQPPKD